MTNIAILASGSGTNAQRICEYFDGHPSVRVCLILSNNPDAYVLTRAQKLGVRAAVFSRKAFYESSEVVDLLAKNGTGFIVLAGFLWLLPPRLLEAYPGKIINIHPALLPRYGGKGMYGNHVHEAVIRSGDTESGISIHYVNEHYDEGDVIFQARCPVFEGDTPETLAGRIHELEYRYFPEVIENILSASR